MIEREWRHKLHLGTKIYTQSTHTEREMKNKYFFSYYYTTYNKYVITFILNKAKIFDVCVSSCSCSGDGCSGCCNCFVTCQEKKTDDTSGVFFSSAISFPPPSFVLIMIAIEPILFQAHLLRKQQW